MKVFLTLSPSASTSSDKTWKHIFYDTLIKLGHDVVFVDYNEVKKSFINKKNPIDKISEKI
jgi:hypothetical protein